MITRIDFTNIILLIVSLIIAVFLPFELFLLSYAILGPLHYLTEISWLHQRQYFIAKKSDSKAMLTISIAAALTITIFSISALFFKENIYFTKFQQYSPSLVFLVFGTALILNFISDWWWRMNSFVLVLLLSFLFKEVWAYQIIFGFLLTTVIHVWIFTGLFILNGALRNKGFSGYILFLFFLICSASFYLIPKNSYVINEYFLDILSKNNLFFNEIILQVLNIPFEKKDLLSSPSALKAQAFIAFIYTYHYLNWFSKVEIIKWNKVPKIVLISMILFWLTTIMIYFYDYKLGFYLLLFLSVLHVFLELPLNLQTIRFLTALSAKRNSITL